MAKKITPRTLKGFRDYLPETMIPRRNIIETAARIYQSYGFVPIDTPALEYLEILTGKGSDETDKQLYSFQDKGGRDLGMRFDLTVPLARFVSQHANELGMPFKRFHIATVWRGENTQAGRYREFMQCDFDTIGTLNISADIECTLVIYDLLRAIGFENFTIHLNNRKVLSGLLEKLGFEEKTVPVLRALDKIAKIGHDAVKAEMGETAGLSPEQAEEVLKLTALKGSNLEILEQIAAMVAGTAKGEEGVSDLRQVLEAAAAVGITEKNLVLDVSIARGLDYYTGTIWETFLDDLPGFGSVCSGGRYDNLTGIFMNNPLPGIGASARTVTRLPSSTERRTNASAGAEPSSHRHGAAWNAERREDRRRGFHPVLRQNAASRVPPDGENHPLGRHRRGDLPGSEKARRSAPVRGPQRLPLRGDRRGG